MGWTYQPKPNGKIKDHLIKEINWERNGRYVEVLDLSIVQIRTAYAAIEVGEIVDGQRQPEHVVGLVIMLDFRKNDDFGFGTKFLEETMGPMDIKCPEKILDLLTPTDNEYAQRWRENCRQYHAQRKLNKAKRKVGLYLAPSQGQAVDMNGQSIGLFKVVEYKPRKLALQVADQYPNKLYKLTNGFLSGLTALDGKPDQAVI